MQNEQKFLEFTLKRLIGCSQHFPGIPRLAELDIEPNVACLAGLLEDERNDAAILCADEIVQMGVSLDYGGEAVIANLVSYAEAREGLAGAVRAWIAANGAGAERGLFYEACENVVVCSLHLRISVLAEAIALSGKQSPKIDRLLEGYYDFLDKDDVVAEEECEDAGYPSGYDSDGGGEAGIDFNFAIAAARYAGRFPDGDPFVDAAFVMAEAARSGRFMFTIFIFPNGQPKVGTFGRDNYGSLPLFAMEFYSAAQKGASVIARRFEDGPDERLSGEPYKTIGGAAFRKGKWQFLSEKDMKDSHSTDHKTGRRIRVEDGVLFSTIPELLPNFLKKPNFSKPEVIEIDTDDTLLDDAEDGVC